MSAACRAMLGVCGPAQGRVRHPDRAEEVSAAHRAHRRRAGGSGPSARAEHTAAGGELASGGTGG